MARYIDSDKLIEYANNSSIGIDANDIARFPAADVVEVVRCKECKRAKRLKFFPGFYKCCRCRCCRKAHDFCSYGERRDT